MHSHESCPCFSGKKYEECCRPFHQGVFPQNALLLMRSRFSAYVLNLADYIIETTHPASPQYSENKFLWKRSISQFSQKCFFSNLKVLDFKEHSIIATVTFTAHISQEGQDATFTERSTFEKKNDQWLYRGGLIAQGQAPNLVTTAPLRLLPLAYYGDPVLRRKGDSILEITDDIKKLIEEMIETMDDSDGIGLAAPQVHHSLRLFVIHTPIQKEENKLEKGSVKVFINPILSLPSSETWQAPEGCLSIPTLRGVVERPKEVTVEYTTLEGKRIQEHVSGWEARVIMHEYDHIEGILYIDRLPEEEQAKLKPFLDNIEKRIHGDL